MAILVILISAVFSSITRPLAKQTHRHTQTDADERYTPATVVGVTKVWFPLAELTARVDG